MNLSVTTNMIYIRFHGLEGGAAHDYSRGELRSWADYISEQAAEGRTLYIYFNNDINVRAPENARMLMEMIGRYAVYPSPTHRLRATYSASRLAPRSRRIRDKMQGSDAKRSSRLVVP